MMLLGVLGINHKSADLPLRERLAKVCDRRFGMSHSFVLLSTCNRTEIYFSSDDLAMTHSYLLRTLRYDVEGEFEHKLYSYFGFDCFLHLCKVASGMDSAILAETEIQGQVKAAYEKYASHRVLSRELHFLFQKSLKISKEIRSSLHLSKGMPTLEEAVLQVISSYFDKDLTKRLLFVGASDINKKLSKHLMVKGFTDMTFCNRTQKNAEELTLQVLPWQKKRDWQDYDIVIAATKCPDYLLREEDKLKFSKKQLLIDLSVPRNIDPLLAAYDTVTLFNIDQINQIIDRKRESKLTLLDRIDQLIHESVEMQMRLYSQRRLFSCSTASRLS